MPLYNIPALALKYKISRKRVREWWKENRFPEPDEFIGKSPIWYEVPPRPEPLPPGKKPTRA